MFFLTRRAQPTHLKEARQIAQQMWADAGTPVIPGHTRQVPIVDLPTTKSVCRQAPSLAELNYNGFTETSSGAGNAAKASGTL